jgi:hypothetical protein
MGLEPRFALIQGGRPAFWENHQSPGVHYSCDRLQSAVYLSRDPHEQARFFLGRGRDQSGVGKHIFQPLVDSLSEKEHFLRLRGKPLRSKMYNHVGCSVDQVGLLASP